MDGVGGFAELMSKFGYGTIGLAVIIMVFLYMIIYITKTMSKNFEEIIVELKILQDLVKNDNLNNLSTDSAKAIIRNQLTNSKYELIEEIMTIYTENDLKNDLRQLIISERLFELVKNLIDKDNDSLSKYKYRDNKLTYFIENLNVDVVAKPLIMMIFERSMTRSDVYKGINTIYNSIINAAKESINDLE
jgi:hypothetical protein